MKKHFVFNAAFIVMAVSFLAFVVAKATKCEILGDISLVALLVSMTIGGIIRVFKPVKN